MTFLGVLQKVEGFLGVAAQVGVAVAPEVAIFNPAAGALLNLVSGAVIKAEAQITADKAGPQKKVQAHTEIMAGLNLAFALTGRTIPNDLEPQVSTAIDNLVSVMNSLQEITKVTHV